MGFGVDGRVGGFAGPLELRGGAWRGGWGGGRGELSGWESRLGSTYER